MGDDDESPHAMYKASHTGGCCRSRLDIHGIDGRGSGTEEEIYTDACEGSNESRYIIQHNTPLANLEVPAVPSRPRMTTTIQHQNLNIEVFLVCIAIESHALL